MVKQFALDSRHTHVLPAFTGLPERGKNQLQAALLIEEARDSFGASALLGKSPLQQIGGANPAVVDGRALQERQTGFEIIGEAGHRRREAFAVGIQEVLDEQVS